MLPIYPHTLSFILIDSETHLWIPPFRSANLYWYLVPFPSLGRFPSAVLHQWQASKGIVVCQMAQGMFHLLALKALSVLVAQAYVSSHQPLQSPLGWATHHHSHNHPQKRTSLWRSCLLPLPKSSSICWRKQRTSRHTFCTGGKGLGQGWGNTQGRWLTAFLSAQDWSVWLNVT